MLKKKRGEESNGKLPHLFIPRKTATFVAEFAVDDLPFEQNCNLGSCIFSERPDIGQNTVMIII